MENLNYKTETIRTYNLYAEKFDAKFGVHFLERVKNNAGKFLSVVSGKKILDMGSGPGNHAEYFAANGYDVMCVDLSEEMVKVCRQKGLHAEVMDIENLMFPPHSFDGIWAYASLLHVTKIKLPDMVASIVGLLVPQGICVLAVKKGIGEQFETSEDYPDCRRYFVYYTDEEVRAAFCPYFDVLEFIEDNVKNKYVFMNYLLQLKKTTL